MQSVKGVEHKVKKKCVTVKKHWYVLTRLFLNTANITTMSSFDIPELFIRLNSVTNHKRNWTTTKNNTQYTTLESKNLKQI